MPSIVNGQWVADPTPTTPKATPTGSTTATSPTSTNTTNSQTTNNTSDATKNSTSTTNTTNMSPSALAALNTLIAQLMSGGTPNQQADRAAIKGEIRTLGAQRTGYSKEAAFNDAQGIMGQQLRLTLEKLLPSINSASLGAGASQSSMRALLTQKAGENAAQNAAAAGLNASISYGQISNQMSGVIANLLGIPDPVAAALINSLNVAKGAVTSSTTKGTDTTHTTGTQTATNNQATTTAGATQTVTPMIPMGGASLIPNNAANTAPLIFGPQQTDQSIAMDNLKYVGTTEDTLRQLWGATDFASNYQI